MPTSPSAKPDLDALPTAPSRGDSPSVFRTRADAFLGALVTFGSQMSSLATWISSTATQVYDNAVEAAASAATATSAANATEWVSGASYTQGDQVWSPSNFLTYRAKTTHSGEATDPSSDSTNWALAVGAGYAPIASPAFTGTPTAPTQTAGDNSTKVATTAYVDGIRALDVLDEATVTSSTASVIFELPTSYEAFELLLFNVQGSATESFQIELGSGAATFHTGALDYAWAYTQNGTAATTDTADDSAILHTSVSSADINGVSARICLFVDSGGTYDTHLSSISASNGVTANGYAKYVGGGSVTHVRVSFQTGTIESGRFQLRALTKAPT